MRARKLSREMLNFWRKRDRELADGKRKRGKFYFFSYIYICVQKN
jgi:hypothetical protein